MKVHSYFVSYTYRVEDDPSSAFGFANKFFYLKEKITKPAHVSMISNNIKNAEGFNTVVILNYHYMGVENIEQQSKDNARDSSD